MAQRRRDIRARHAHLRGGVALATEARYPAPAAGAAARLAVLAIVAAAGFVAFLGIQPSQPWLLWLTAALVGLAADGTVRSHPRWEKGGTFASLVYLFLPVLAALAAGYFIDRAVDGYARPLAALGGAAGVAFVTYGEYETVDFRSRIYGAMRLALAVATYLAAFALYAVIYTDGPPLAASSVLIALVSLALAMELLRESRLLGPSSLLVGIAIGVSMAELRLTFYFFPLDGILAGALLIIGFYLATGLVHHLLDHDLEFGTMAEYVLVSGVGAAAVVITRTVV